MIHAAQLAAGTDTPAIRRMLEAEPGTPAGMAAQRATLEELDLCGDCLETFAAIHAGPDVGNISAMAAGVIIGVIAARARTRNAMTPPNERITDTETEFVVTITHTNRGRAPQPEDVRPPLMAQGAIWADDGIDVLDVHVERVEP